MKIYFFITLLLGMFPTNAIHFFPQRSLKKQKKISAKTSLKKQKSLTKIICHPKEQCITALYQKNNKGKKETKH